MAKFEMIEASGGRVVLNVDQILRVVETAHGAEIHTKGFDSLEIPQSQWETLRKKLLGSCQDPVE